MTPHIRFQSFTTLLRWKWQANGEIFMVETIGKTCLNLYIHFTSRVSNDEYSAQLGRRDITMAWHKTTKDVQEITDVIDLQGPARDYNMPSRDPAI
ncbi:hypothetical protein BC332_06878 [Capsicum chinense]|nr:hypothetical protein BC332_06878 [Capsicum chinense]